MANQLHIEVLETKNHEDQEKNIVVLIHDDYEQDFLVENPSQFFEIYPDEQSLIEFTLNLAAFEDFRSMPGMENGGVYERVNVSGYQALRDAMEKSD